MQDAFTVLPQSAPSCYEVRHLSYIAPHPLCSVCVLVFLSDVYLLYCLHAIFILDLLSSTSSAYRFCIDMLTSALVIVLNRL